MAGVYIKGMEMPKDKYSYTEIQIWGDGTVCTREGTKLIWGKSAIEVPDHGDLIDRDAMAEDLAYDVEMDERALDNTDIVGIERTHLQFDKDCKQNCMYYLTEQEAVIPAKRREYK